MDQPLKTENDMPIPEFLFHYTSVDVLELILQNRTIRFNSLVNMDDIEEARTADFGSSGKYVYISSWADDDTTENVAMWGMYSNHYEGIRIKMKKNPFVLYQTGPLPYFENDSVESYIPRETLERNNLYLYPTLPRIRRVEYTNQEDQIVGSMIISGVNNPDGTFNIVANLNDLGRYKRDAWAPQKEVRYLFCVIPHNSEGSPVMNVEFNKEGLPFDHWDVSLTDEGFNSIEVTIGPKVNPVAQNRVITLMNRFFPGDAVNRVHYSVLKIK